MFAAAFHTSRHYILFTVMACLCVLLGGPSYAAGAESLFIAGATYCEPGVSGTGWAWTDADHLELNGYTGEAVGADGDLVVTLVGQNSVVETHAPDADISMSGTLVAAHFATPAGGAFGAASVLDADGSVAPHVVIEPDDAVGPAGETVTPGGEVPGDGTGEPTGGADPAAGQPGAGSATDPAVKPAATSLKTTVTKTTVTKTTKPKSTMATTTALPKTGDSHWIAASITLFLLGTVLLSAAYRC